jgi:hypothetical protein
VIAAPTVLRSAEAVTVGHQALVRLYDTRHWSRIWMAVEIVAGGLFLPSAVEVAARIYGHLDAHHPVWGGERAKRGRSKALEWLRSQPHAEVLHARGTAMTGNEVVHLVLDELARQAGTERVTKGSDLVA